MADVKTATTTDPAKTEGGSTTATVVPAKKPAPPTPKLLPPFRVLLHNDDVNDFDHVIRCIIRLTSLSLEDAVQRTLEAHQSGVALLLVTHKERAELYCEQFATFQLTVTAEPA